MYGQQRAPTECLVIEEANVMAHRKGTRQLFSTRSPDYVAEIVTIAIFVGTLHSKRRSNWYQRVLNSHQKKRKVETSVRYIRYMTTNTTNNIM